MPHQANTQRLFPDKIMNNISNFQKAGHMADIMICTGMKEIPCHKLILAASSPYFDAMFNSGMRESKERQVFIQGISEYVMETIIGYFYTGDISLNSTNALEMFEASDLLQVETLKSDCAEFILMQISCENCLDVWRLATKYNSPEMEKAATEYLTHNFQNVINQQYFLDLSCDEMCTILSRDSLNVQFEETVCEAAIRWLYNNYSHRKTVFAGIVRQIRLPLVKTNYLIEHFQTKLGEMDKTTSKIMDEAKTFHLLPAKRFSDETPRSKSRLRHARRDTLLLFGLNQAVSEITGTKAIRLDLGNMTLYDTDEHQITSSTDFAVCSYGCDIYLSGGSKTSIDFHHFQSSDQKWKQEGSLCEGRSRHAMAAVTDYIYSIGGNLCGNFISSIEQYSVKTQSSKIVGSLRHAVSLTVVEVISNRIYILGGLISEQACTAIVQVFDTETNETTTLNTELPIRCALHRSSICEGKIYVVTRAGKFMEFSYETGAKLIQPIDNFKRGNYAMFNYHGSVYLVENHATDPCCLIIHIYNKVTNEWRIINVKHKHDLPTVTGCARTFIEF